MAKKKQNKNPFSAAALKRRLGELSGRLDGRWEKLRFERALSWLERSEKESGIESGRIRSDRDVQFVLLWVALDALFGRERDVVARPRSRIPDRVAALMKEDRNGVIWDGFRARPDEVFGILRNRYIFNPFWKAVAEGGVHSQERAGVFLTPDNFGRSCADSEFKEENLRVFALLKRGNAHGRRVVAQIIFRRLGTLRNQLMHGSSEHSEPINRSQVEDGYRLLSALAPRILHVMMESPDLPRGVIAYPPIGEKNALFDGALDRDEFRRLIVAAIRRQE